MHFETRRLLPVIGSRDGLPAHAAVPRQLTRARSGWALAAGLLVLLSSCSRPPIKGSDTGPEGGADSGSRVGTSTEDTVGVTDTETSPDASVDAATQCAPSIETDPCFKCTDEFCCNEYALCKGDARCGLFYKECLPQCTASGKSFDRCTLECDSTNGAGHSVFAPYQACNQRNCLGPCANGDPDACTSCLFASCPNQATACAGDSNCRVLDACMAVCRDDRPGEVACSKACSDTAGVKVVAKWEARNTCLEESCSSICK